MIISVSLVLVMLVAYLFKAYYFGTIRNFPSHPGKLPLLGNLLMFFGDGNDMFNAFVSLSMQCLKTDGYNSASLGPVTVYVFSDPDDCAILANPSNERHYTYRFTKYWLGDGIFTADATTWKRNRKLLNPLFSQNNINQILPLFNKHARELTDELSMFVGKGPFNHEPLLLMTFSKTICQATFELDVEEQSIYSKQCLKIVTDMFEKQAERQKRFWLHSDFLFKQSSLWKRQAEQIKVFNNLTDRVINRRTKLIDDEPELHCNKEQITFVDKIIRIAMKNHLPHESIRQETNTIIGAGMDTISSTLTYALMLLGHHTDVQEKAYKEIQDVLENSEREVSKDDIAKLQYLDAVVKETMRLYPVAPTMGRVAHEDIKLRKFTLPKGSQYVISLYAIHRHPLWGADAEQFNPERWLNPDTLPQKSNLFAPFALGKRNCIGKTFATMAMKVTLVQILRKYSITSDINKLKLKLMTVIKPYSGQHISIESRKLF